MSTFRIVTLLSLALCTLHQGEVASAELDGSVAGTVSITKDGKAASAGGTVVVYLRDVARTSRDEKRKAVIRQHDLQFSPRVTVVIKGTTIEFPNDDKVFHNVFSASRAARFDLGLYRSGGVKSVELRREGVVDVFCNIHPEMSSRVLVVPTHHFAVADQSGKFRIDGVPPGTYPAVAWHASGGEASGTVTVAAGSTATLSLEVAKQDEPSEHKRKDGTPYLRYE